MKRSSGVSVFSETETNTTKVIECLKSSGMPIKDIKQFLEWCQEGDASLEKRCNMFHERYEEVAKRINATGSVCEQDLAEIKGTLAEIWKTQKTDQRI